MTELWSPSPFLVAGPCALEDDRVNLEVATALAELSVRLGIRTVFKGSFDKANRTSVAAARGLGLEPGLAALDRVRQETNLPVLTDVHDVAQVPAVAQVTDALQIPAFLCRQTDLLVAAGRTGLPINIKKGQWMDADGVTAAVTKVRFGGESEVAVTERGTFFGYGDLVVDMRSIPKIQASGTPVLIDATHAVQRPGVGPGPSSGGDRPWVPTLLMAAAAAGADGFFIETHPDPDSAPSDSATMWPLADMVELVDRALAVWHAARSPMRAELER
jgi:2-dehydro-3-deoxyphosphooctonate aldolase (KDO 8-P synthase)